jgi:DHA3 family macrolide efflux protein-like MFS transporter
VPVLGVFLGLALGLLVGGSVDNLTHIRLRGLPVLVVAALARFGLDAALSAGSIPDGERMWLVLVTYSLLTAMLISNRNLPGLTAAALGTAANGIAIVANGGWMPVWQSSLAAAGFDPTVIHSNFHKMLTGPPDASFFAHGGPLVDVIPIPLPIIQSVSSIGDILLGAGLAFFLFAALVRPPAVGWGSVPAGGSTAAWPGLAPTRPGALDHPYVRLATNGPFSAIWLGQVISSLGDRVHQVALVFLVAGDTANSPLALGMVFAAMTLPTVIVGPFAGALVDRWDRKRVMVGSDLLRAAIVALIPLLASVHVGIVMILVFALATVSAFFRPARTAALPQVVPEDDLMTANSAMWVADTAADLVGYSLGGLFVAFLGSSLALAFWVDGASYVASGVLVAAVAIPRVMRSGTAVSQGLRGDLVAGWEFLRSETVLMATTVQAAVAEFGLGALTCLSPLIIAGLALGDVEVPAAYGLFEMAMGIGLVGGGLIVGAMATRLPKGPAIIGAFVALGVVLAGLAVSPNLALTLVLAAAVGLANVTFVVPSQTIFQERTPGDMLGRVVAIRLAAVNGALALAMIASGALAQAIGVQPVLIACGLLTSAAGLAGIVIRPIRRA